jgi:N-acetylneuraminic acid mutarotase
MFIILFWKNSMICKKITNGYSAMLLLVLSGMFSCQTYANSAVTLDIPSLPEKTSNNAVAYVDNGTDRFLVSFSGIGEGKSHSDVHNKTFVYQLGNETWSQGTDVPMVAKIVDEGVTKKHANLPAHYLRGRLASIATSIGNKAYVFGGYTVASDHKEVSVPDVYSYNVVNDKFTLLAPMPVPVDDSVALTYQERFIYLVSGWHNDGNVNLVQVYDTVTNRWTQASPFPGSPVFGHSAGIVGDTMLICDGVKVQYHENKRRDFTAEPACYTGVINAGDINKIDWRKVKHPTGKARYRMAATGSEKLNQILFVGGSENAYNYDGIGYNGKPSEPTASVWRFNLATKLWTLSTTSHASMDHRGLLAVDGQFLTVGGMGKKQQVMGNVLVHKF